MIFDILNQKPHSLEFKVSHDPGIVAYPVSHMQSCRLRIAELFRPSSSRQFICNNKIPFKSIPFAYKNGRHFRKSKPDPQIPPGFAFYYPFEAIRLLFRTAHPSQRIAHSDPVAPDRLTGYLAT